MQQPENVVSLDRDPPTPSDGGAPRAQKGGGGDKKKTERKAKPEKPFDFGRFNELLEHFVLIYGTDTVIDLRKKLIMKIGALRLAYGSDYVKAWLGTDLRKMITQDQLVFDPTGRAEPPAVNLYEGFALQPDEGNAEPLIAVLRHLCSGSAATEEGDQAILDWVLDWLAYPLQHPGAKMATALVFHGTHGAGKNLWFEAIAKIYGRYALVVGQDQLEDKFNDWASQKLFVIGDEVVARAELFHQKNKLKAFVTGETIQINAKMLPLRTERNHVNVVFLSNEDQPLAVETADRRYMVVYTPTKAAPELYAAATDCLDLGGAQWLMHYLLKRDLSGFGPHSKPLMTKAKADLIELGMKPAERFVREWRGGFLPLQLVVCSNEQLYRAFRRWCAINGERFPPPQVTFSKSVEKVAHEWLRQQVIKLDHAEYGKKAARMWVPAGLEPPEGKTRGAWAAEGMNLFEEALRAYTGSERES